MAEINKVSLLYVVAEDRLAMDTEDLEGATTRLWLTQRLCRGLVGAIVPMLQTTAGARMPQQPQETVQSWAQAAAMQDFGRLPGVQPGPGTVNGLVRAVHITPQGDRVSLVFDFGAGESRTVSLSGPALRQTLSVMHRLHVEAGWPLDLWPGWIAEPAAQAAGGAVN